MEKVETIVPYGDGNAKADEVRRMFDGIARSYDRLNALMSFGLHRRWLARLIRQAVAGNPVDILDMATGTGDVAIALAKAAPGAKIRGLDLSEGMLAMAERKSAGLNIDYAVADCTTTGLPDASVDAVTIAYGIRNFADIAAGIAEAHRVLRPGGSFHILELSQPQGFLRPFYKLYTSLALPLMGKIISGDRRAYAYLPASIAACPQRRDMTALMAAQGFSECSFTPLSMGICTLYKGRK